MDALDGDPGVHSARYAGEDKNDEANVEKLLREMKGKKDRRARFKTVIALNLENHELLFTGICPGSITQEKRGTHGFGYDPVFQPEGHDQTFAEMELQEKGKLSHRGKATRELVDYLCL